MGGFLHGVEIIAGESGGASVESVSTSIICVVGTSHVLAEGEARLVINPLKISEVFGESVVGDKYYTLPDALKYIFYQSNCIVIALSAGDIGALMKEGNADNLWETAADNKIVLTCAKIVNIESMTGYLPKILICPGYSNSATVRAALKVAGDSLLATVILDGDRDPEAMEKTDFPAKSKRFYPVTPWLVRKEKIAAVDTKIYVPPSSAIAGALSYSDNARGWWRSPSNLALQGIEELSNPVGFSLGDKESLANKLNGKGIACIIRHQGYRLWGNRTQYDVSETDYKFISVSRTIDVIDDSIQRAHLWAVDRGLSKRYFEEVCDNVNSYLKELTTMGAIAGGECQRHPTLNSTITLKNGEAHFYVSVSPTYPAEHITFHRQISSEFLVNILK